MSPERIQFSRGRRRRGTRFTFPARLVGPVTSIFPIMIAISWKDSARRARPRTCTQGPRGEENGMARRPGGRGWRASPRESMKNEELAMATVRLAAFFRRTRDALSDDAFVLGVLCASDAVKLNKVARYSRKRGKTRVPARRRAGGAREKGGYRKVLNTREPS